MAMPIKETPILYDEDSDHFLKEVKENENNKVPIEDYNKAVDIYIKVMRKTNFKVISA